LDLFFDDLLQTEDRELNVKRREILFRDIEFLKRSLLEFHFFNKERSVIDSKTCVIRESLCAFIEHLIHNLDDLSMLVVVDFKWIVRFDLFQDTIYLLVILCNK